MPGGFSIAWNRLCKSINSFRGNNVIDPDARSDLKAWFMLHMNIGPEVKMVRPMPRRARTLQQSTGPRYPAALLGALELLANELAGRSPLDLQWCVTQLGQLLDELRTRDTPGETQTDSRSRRKPIRIQEPQYVVDLDLEDPTPEEPDPDQE